ncbi:MAG: CARDB domain-containing protein [Pseudomonadota bacterium]|nr:CARDB domain-containing protein [Pseudomonadota bacterium]
MRSCSVSSRFVSPCFVIYRTDPGLFISRLFKLEAEAWGGAGNDVAITAESLDASSHALLGTADRLALLGDIAAGTSDWYNFSLAAGQAASMAVTRADNAILSGLTLELYDLDGTTLLATGIADAGNVDQSISAFLAPTTGTYSLRVSAAADLPYSLVVTRGAEFGLENPSETKVQNLSLTNQALGALGGAGGGAGGAIRVAVLDSGQAYQVLGQLNDDTWFDFTATSVAYTDIDSVAELANYDVVIFGDSSTSHAQIAAIAPALRQWVEAGGGVVGTGWAILTAGSYYGTAVADIDAILPVDTTVGHLYQYNPLIDITDNDHPVSSGVMDFYPGYYAEYSPTVDPGASVLGWAGGQAAIVVGHAGAGRGVYLGPTYMVSAGGDLDIGSADRLLEQAVAWAAGDRSDAYGIEVAAGAELDIRTWTPGDGIGEPVNNLDARLELYDPNGNLVAGDDNGAADGRNARLLFTAGMAGRHEIRVLIAGATENSGAYLLQVNGATTSSGPAPSVIGASPTEAANFIAPPTTITLTFSEALLATSVQASDLTLALEGGGGFVPDDVTLVDGRTLRFTIDLLDVAGDYTYSLAEGAVSDLQGQGNIAHTGHFTVDHTGPRVVSQTPAVQASAPFSQMAFTFSEALDPATVSTADIVSFTGPGGGSLLNQITGIAASGNTLTVNFTAQTTQGTYIMALGPNIRDQVGNLMDQNQDAANGQADDVYTTTVDLQSPDLRAVSLSNPGGANWGENISVTWTVENIGSDPARENWYDSIYLSSDTTLGGDTQLHTQSASVNPLAAGAGYSRTVTFALPLDWDPSAGDYYLLLKTDTWNQQLESNENNNVAVGNAIHITLPAKPDAVVSDISAPADVVLNPTGNTTVPFSWTVTNSGTAAMTNWHDYVWMSTDQTVGSDIWVGDFEFLGTLNPGESVTRTQNLSLPFNVSGDRWLVVRTEARDQHYEVTNAVPPSHPDAENNNTLLDDQKFSVIFPPIPNLQVSAITPPDHSYSGQDAVISWTVSNVGAGATSVPTWYDAVYLSSDTELGGDLYLGRTGNPSFLAASGGLGDNYTSSLHFTLPQGISGDYYYLVKTDYLNNVFENQNENDNLGNAAVVVELTPPPDLQVVARNPDNNEWESSVRISAPGGLWSGQAATVTWTVSNRGEGTTAPAGGWYDRVYMSEDSTYGGGDTLLGTFWHSGVLAGGQNYTRSENVVLPTGMPADGVPTTYHFFVVTDTHNHVYEYVNEGNNSNSYVSAVVSLTPPPDLEPGPINLPATAEAGHAFFFNYSVTNYGTPTPNNYWVDRFWLSADDVLDASDLHLGDRGHSGVLDTDASYTGGFSYTLPYGMSGDYRVIMNTDIYNHVFEGLDNPGLNYYPEGNNRIVSDVMTVVSKPADLVVDSFTSNATGEAGKTISASWTVRNAGSGDSVVSGWTDQIIASVDAVLGNGDDVLLYTHNHSGLLAAGASYSVNAVSVALPITLAAGDYTLFLRTDAGNQVYESDNGNNSAANALTLARETADLQVVSMGGLPGNVTAGGTLSLNWRVENLGVATTNANYWYDDVYLSLDTTLGSGDISLGSLRHNNALAVNAGYDTGTSFTLSTSIAAGDYYVLVRADSNNLVVESPSESNNTLASAGTVNVAAWVPGTPKPVVELRPDLTVTALTLPPEAYSGQGVTLAWTVVNQSATDNTGLRWWNDNVYLSRDLYFDRYSDLYIGYAAQHRDLAAGDSYSVSKTFTIPAGYTGPFYAFVVTDSSGGITESDESNNIMRSANVVDVSLAPPANLVAGSITIPANGVPGQQASITYSVSNESGANAIVGTWKDTLYLSSDTQWDIGDAALGSIWTTYTSGNPLDGGESYSHTLNVTLPGVDPGDYHVIVRSDILNYVNETNEADNLSASLDAVNLDAVVLPLGGSVSGSLGHGQAVYYKLDVGAGETVKLDFDSAGVNIANEIYVRYGTMPSLGRFDHSSLEAYSADPSVLIPETQAGTYYVMVHGASVSGAPAYTLTSQVIPFSITGVRTDVVGNAGEATLRIDGARFAEATQFALRAPDGTLHVDSQVFVENSSRVYATFNLLLVDAGSYDVVAVQANGQTTLLEDAVTVIDEARGGNLFSLIQGPSQVTTSRVNSFILQYTNQGDGDAMAPLLVITGQADTPLGYNSLDLRTEPIHFLGASLDGPMDILRPDTGYSQQVLFRSPATDGQLNISVATIQATDDRVIDSARWSEIETSIKPATPAGMSDAEWDAEWDAFWGRIRAAMGDTWGDYVRMLNQAMLLVSEQGSPVRDARTLMATVHAQHPDWRPASNLSGTLRDAETGAALANVQLAAYRDTARGLALGGYASTDGDGHFTLSGLQPGTYTLALSGGVYDMNRNGEDDSSELNVAGDAPLGLPGFAVSFSADSETGDLFVLDTTQVAHTDDSVPVLATAPDGTPHILWQRDGRAWHAWFDGGNWVDAVAISSNGASELNLVAAGNLLDGNDPGLIAVWQQNGGNDLLGGNDSEIFYAVARPAVGGGYQWSEPVRLTSDVVSDRGIEVVVVGDGQVLIVDKKENVDVQDDADIYYYLVDVATGGLLWTASPTALQPAYTVAYSYDEEYGPWTALGMKVGASIGLAGEATQSGCAASVGVSGGAKLTLEGDNLGLTIEGKGSLSAEWGVDLIKRDWDFHQATAGIGISGELDWKNGLLKLLGAIPTPATKAAATFIEWATDLINATGVVEASNGIKGSIGLDFKGLQWTIAEPFPDWVWPNIIAEAAVSASLKAYAGIQIKDDDDWKLEVSGGIVAGVNVYPSVELTKLGGELGVTLTLWGWDFSPDPWFLGYDKSDLMLLGDAGMGAPLYTLSWNGSLLIGSNANYNDGVSRSLLADVAADVADDGSPAVASDAAGSYAAWSHNTGDIGSVVRVSGFDGNAWSAPTDIAGSLGFNNNVNTVTDAAGNRMVIWTHADTSGLTHDSDLDAIQAARDANQVMYSVFDGSTWSAPTLLAATAGRDASLTLTRDVSGNTVLGWIYSDSGGVQHLLSATWDGSVWNAPETIAGAAHLGQLELGLVGGTLTAFWTEDVSAAGDSSETSLRSASYTGGVWSAAGAFSPTLLSASLSVTGAATAQGFSLAGSEVPLQTESLPGLLFGPPPDECFKCKPEDIKKVTESAPNCRPGGGSDVQYDPEKCLERTIIYAPCAVRPRDPNDILGPNGFGEENWITATETQAYTIRFENAADATAPAQQVVINQVLDEDLDPRTFRVDDFGWGDTRQELDANRSFYTARLDFTASDGYYVDVTATVDVPSHTVTWTLTTIDPATGEMPADASIGFLPVNDTVYDADHQVVVEGTHRGEGFVSYTVRSKSASTTGAVVDAQASIVFDTQGPIETPAIAATLDAVAPESAVDALPAGITPASGDSAEFLVSWGGSDDSGGSAIADYTIYVSVDGGGYGIWQLNTPLSEALYTGTAGHTYAFYSTARDNAGNEEAVPAGADTETTVSGGSGGISGVKYEDMDGDGIRDAGEAGLSGWTLYLDTDGNGALDAGETSVVTGADGAYSFTGLSAGNHVLAEVAQAGWVATTPAGGSRNVTVVGGETATADFGNFHLAQIGGIKFNDLNGNGAQDAGEDGLEGWTITLDQGGDGTIDATQTTNPYGYYTFTDLGPGTYVVSEVPQSGWLQTTPAAGSYTVVPYSGEDSGSNDFGNVEAAAISGRKFEDVNGNNQWDAGEPGLAGWTIYLDSNANGVLEAGERATLTDLNGDYRFDDLLPGAYTVAEVMQAGWVQTWPAVAGGNVTLTASEALLTLPEELVLNDVTAEQAMGNTLATSLTNLDGYRADARFASLNGGGIRTVVIDTGIDLNHGFFGPDADLDGIADRIVYQWDFADDDGNASDVNGHGSNVSSLIASSDAMAGGVAPDADLIALKVFSNAGSGNFGYLEQALQWTLANIETWNIGVINMSLGDGENWASAASMYGIGDELAALANSGVIVTAAAGNSYYQYNGQLGVSYPAADPAVLAVGALWSGDFGGAYNYGSGAIDYTTGANRIAAFSQRDDDQLDVFAPGTRLIGANASGGTVTMYGTSQASAYLAGIATLAQDVAWANLGRALGTAEFAGLLASTGNIILDGDDENDNVANTGLSFHTIDMLALAEGILSLGGGGAGGGAGSGAGDPGTGFVAGPATHSVTLAAGDSVSGKNFGNFQLGEISGILFDDLNGDGARDAGESGLTGWTIWLDVDRDGVLDPGETRIDTGLDGGYSFTGVGPGTHRVSVFDPGGWGYTGDRFFDVFMPSGGSASHDFGANQTPTAGDDTASGDEDQTLSGNVSNNDSDPDGPAYGAQLVTDVANGTLSFNADGSFSYQPTANWSGSDGFSYRVFDGVSYSNEANVVITINPVNDAPVAANDSYDVLENHALTVTAPGVLGNDSDLEGDSLSASLVSGPAHGLLSLAAGGGFTYTPDSDYVGADSFTYRVADSDPGNVATVSLTIAPDTLKVTGLAVSDSGFHLDFNRAFQLDVLNLYSAADDPMGEADLILTRLGAPSAIRGSLILDHDLMGATFIKTKGVLDAGLYTLTLASRADAWVDSAGRLLDGNGDGIAGDNHVSSFTVAASSSAILGIGEVLVGPGQALTGYAPYNQYPVAGLPITLSNAAGITSLSFDLAYDPDLLDITSVGFASGVAGSYSLATPGIVHVELTTPALGSGAVDIVRLYGAVPVNDTTRGNYGAKQVLDLHNVSSSRALRADDGLMLNAYPGDASGNAAYDTLDTTRMLRIITVADTGFSAYPLVDSSVVGDINRDQSFNSIDRLLLNYEINWLITGNAARDRKEIAPIPDGIGPITFTGADPLVDLPRDLVATAGSLVSVPVRLDIADNLDQVQLQLAWDASQLELVDVQRGSLTGGFDNYVDNRQAGSLYVDMSSTTRLPGGAGTLLELVFRVANTASGLLDIDLQWTQLNQTRLTLNPAPLPGADPTDGRIRVDPPYSPETPAREETAAAPGAESSPVIDFASRYDGFEFRPGNSNWLGDWLSERRKPDLEALRIQPVIQPKVAPRLSARL